MLEMPTNLDIVLIVGLIIVMVALIVCLHTDNNNEMNESFTSKPPCHLYYNNNNYEQFTNPPTTQNSGSSSQPQNLTALSQIKPSADNVTLLFIYHDKCGHCHSFNPTWNKLYNKYHGKKINSKNVSCYRIGNDTNEGLWNSVSTQYKVNGFPTIMTIDQNGATEYSGPRNELEIWDSHVQKCTQ